MTGLQSRHIPFVRNMDLLIFLGPFSYPADLATDVKDILRIPNLLRIYWVAEMCDIRSLRDLRPSQWCAHGIEGLLIRTYSNGSENLTHIRGRKSCTHHGDPTLPEALRTDCIAHHDWIDVGVYNGQYRVSKKQLSKVYWLLGVPKEFTQPERNMTLPEDAWAVLRSSKRPRNQL